MFIAGDNRALATLSARGFDPNTCDWAQSHCQEAGDRAKVTSWNDSEIWGFDLYASDSNSVPGDWFIIDYKAIGEGDPNIWVYDYSYSFEDPNSFISFSHAPSRDFTDDGAVNLADHAVLSSYWLVDGCNEPNWCDGSDINRDGYVGFDDLALFADYWLGGRPDTPVIPQDPNITFRIADEYGQSEINMDVGQSITLYIEMVTEGVDVNVFHLEADISDPNLGYIDNTPYDTNNPPGPGTARILASPRDPFFDYWAPGEMQSEGIQLRGASLNSGMSDGHLASFVYTCNRPGDVTLEVLNLRASDVAWLEGIIIHQIDPYSTEMMSGSMSMSTMSESVEPETQELSLDEMVGQLEDIWFADDGLQEVVSEKEWRKFIKSVKDSD